MPAFTILLPHKRNPQNDAALAICLDCLVKNTTHDFELHMSAALDQPLYATMNRLVEEAPVGICVFMHSDMFVAPGWDQPMLDLLDTNNGLTFAMGLLVEPGAIGVYSNNIEKDFGRKPESFRRADFEAWSCGSDAPKAHGEGWVAPCMFYKNTWLSNGGHDLRGADDWTQRDLDMLEKFKREGGQVVQAQSPVYHLQRYSDPEEQNHSKRG